MSWPPQANHHRRSMKTTLSAIAIIAAVTFLGGCYTIFPKLDPANLTAQQYRDKHTSVSRDDFKKLTIVKSSTVDLSFELLAVRLVTSDCYLSAEKRDNAKAFYWINLDTSLNKEGNIDPKSISISWESVADQRGNEFPLQEGSTSYWRKDGTTWVDESYYAEVSREYLESIQETGIVVKFYGKRTTRTATIYPSLIKGFLMRVDEVMPSPPPQSSAATTPSLPSASNLTLEALPKVDKMTVQQYKDSHTIVSRDVSNKTITINTGKHNFTLTDSLKEYHQFRAIKKDDGGIIYEFLLYSNRTPPDLFNKAIDQYGNEFPMKEINTNATGGAILKDEKGYSLQLSRESLEGMRKTETKFIFYSKSTVLTLPIEHQIVDGFLMRVEEEFKE